MAVRFGIPPANTAERCGGAAPSMRKADGLLTEFDETLWRSTVDRVEVRTATEMTFTFRDENEIQVNF